VVAFARAHEASGLVLAGHSAGGATAVLVASLLWHEHGVLATEVHTFGAPKFASRAFREAYEGALGRRTWRHATTGDPVPRLPPGYVHVGTPGRAATAADGRPANDGAGAWVAEHRLERFVEDGASRALEVLRATDANGAGGSE
jgi:hypothetical protein